MEFKFDSNQDFQVEAIKAVCDLFDGQTRLQASVRFKTGALSLAAVPNLVELMKDEIAEAWREYSWG